MAIIYLADGGDATQLLQWFASVSGTVVSATDQKHTGPRSYKMTSGAAGALAHGAVTGVLADAGRRISCWLYLDNLPTGNLTIIRDNNSVSGGIYGVGVTSGGLLRCSPNGGLATTGSTLSAGIWYRVEVAHVLTSISNYTIQVFLDGILDITCTNAGGNLAFVSGTDLQIGWSTASVGNSLSLHVDDIYIDDSTTLTDTGNISVTSKLPAAINSNTWNNQIGNGNVNERPLSETNGWSETTTTQRNQNWTLEAANVGDVDITNAIIVGYVGWIWARASSLTNPGTPGLILNNATTAVTLATTSALYRAYVTSASYPSNAAGIGMRSSGAAADTLLYEAGALIAYIPPVIATPDAVALATSPLAPAIEMTVLPGSVALVDSVQAATPVVRALPSAPALAMAMLNPSLTIQALQQAVALLAMPQVPVPALQAIPSAVALSLVAPDPSIVIESGVVATPGVVSLVLSVSDAVAAIQATPGAVMLSATPQAPLPVVQVAPSLATLALSTQAALGVLQATPGVVSLVTAPLAPDLAIQALVQSVALSASAQAATPVAQVPASTVALSLAPLGPAVQISALPGVVVLSMTALAPVPAVQVSQSVVSLLLSVLAPTIVAGAGITVTPSAVALVASLLAPTVTVQALPTAPALSIATLTAIPMIQALPGALGLSLTPQVPVIVVQASTAPVGLILSTLDPVLSIRALPALVSLLLNAPDPTISIITTAVVATPGVVALSLSSQSVQIRIEALPSSVSLALAVLLATIIASSGRGSVTLSIRGVGAITLSGRSVGDAMIVARSIGDAGLSARSVGDAELEGRSLGDADLSIND